MKKSKKTGFFMEPDKKFFIENFWKKTELTLEESRKNIECNALMSVQNRIYYAIFYFVMTLAYCSDFTTSKHATLMGWFNKKFIHETKIFDKNMFKIYQNAFVNRMDSDYSCFYEVTIDDVRSSFDDAKIFIGNIKNYLIQNDIL